MICYNCGNPLASEIDTSCPVCGMNFPLKCNSCNEYNPLYSKFCSNCGFELNNNQHGNLIRNSDVLNENRKQVGVIFADVSGFTALSEKMDPEEVREVINGCFEYITKPVYELEGTIDKYIGDCVMILFGAKYSHHDDAKRAVKCALIMRDLIKEYSKERLFERGIELNISIGISYGLVVTGIVGNRYDKDYTVMGDTVNTAQRLQSSAGKGNILVSEGCYYETNDIIEYSKPKEILVKNKEKPVKCYSPLNIKQENNEDRIKLFEREGEINLIHNVYSKNQGIRFINVIGESGIGKTSLVKSFCREISDAAVKKIWINCSSMLSNKVYYVISEILFNVAAIKSEDSMASKKNKLKTFLYLIFDGIIKKKIDKTYNFLTLVLGLERTEEFNKILKSMEYKDISRETDFQLCLFFEYLYKQHDYIFVIDDIQWADANSKRILNKLADNINNVNSFYVFISQYEIEEMNNKNNIILNKISQSGVREIIKQEFSSDEVDEVLLSSILNFTNGNPLFIKEHIAAIKRGHQYFIQNGRVGISKGYINKLPNSIESIILSNLSYLNEATAVFLQVASCIGKEFNINWVWKILNRNINEKEVTGELKRLNIISLKNVYTSEGILNKIYIFNQDTVKNAIYKSILNKFKKEYNRNIGELIEREYGTDIEEHYTELYNYFFASEDLNRAGEYAYKAAIKFRNDFSLDNALEYYNIFIKLVSENKIEISEQRLVNSYKDMGYIENICGNREKALDYLEMALNLCSLTEDIYSIKLMVAGIYKDIADYDEAFKIIEEIEPKIRENSNVFGQLLFLKCNIYYYKRDKNALAIALDSEKILLKTKDYENLSQTESLIGLLYFVQGDLDNALYYLNNAYEHSEKVYNLKSIARISGNLGVVYHASGRISKALEFFEKSLKTAKEISDVKSYISASINLGILYMEKGKFNKAEELFNKSLKRSEEASLIYLFCINIMNMGDLMYARGNLPKALDNYNKALKIAKDHELKAEEGINYINIVKVKIEQDDLSCSEELLNKAQSILEDINETSGLIDLFRFRSIIEFINKNLIRALEYCNKSIKYAEESEDDFKKQRALRLKGNICLETGQYESALELFNNAVKLSEQLESEYESSKAYYYRSRLYRELNKCEEMKKDLLTVKEYISKVDSCHWKEKLEKMKI